MSERILTISREFGSGGRTVGRMAAKALNIPCYDQEILEELARKSGFTQGYIQEQGEYAAHAGWLSNALASRFSDGLTSQDRLWVLQRELILELAEKGPCVIVGRCADYILRDFDNCLHVFVRSTEEDCIHRVSTYYGVPKEQAVEEIRKINRQRAAHCKRYTDRTWGAAENYDLMLNTARFGIDGCTALICDAAQKAFNPVSGDGVY